MAICGSGPGGGEKRGGGKLGVLTDDKSRSGVMGRKKVKWFSAVKRAFRSRYKASSKKNKDEPPSQVPIVESIDNGKPSKEMQGRESSIGTTSAERVEVEECLQVPQKPEEEDAEKIEKEKDIKEEKEEEEEEEELKKSQYSKQCIINNNAAGRNLRQIEEEQNKHTLAVAVATAAAAEAAAQAAQAAAEVARLTGAARSTFYSNNAALSRQEWAAIKIQAGFRGYSARRELRALKGLVRLKGLVEGQAVQKQATLTLQSMQGLVRVQAQVRARRRAHYMPVEEQEVSYQVWQRQHHEHPEKPVSQGSDGWNDSVQTIESIESKKLSKHEAALKRERALAYAYSRRHWKSSPKHSSSGVTSQPSDVSSEPNNIPQLGWHWIDRWMYSKSWDSHLVCDKDPVDSMSAKGTEEGLIHPTKHVSHESSKAMHPTHSSSPATKIHHHSAMKQPRLVKSRPATPPTRVADDDDGRSTVSFASMRHSTPTYAPKYGRRSSVAGSSVGDDESISGYSAAPRYMSTTESAQQRSRPHSAYGKRNSVAGSSVRDDESLAGYPAPHYMGTTESARARSRPHSSYGKRSSIAGSSIRDDESLAGYPTVPRYMSATESARARSRSHSVPKLRPPGASEEEPVRSPSETEQVVSAARKRLSYPSTAIPTSLAIKGLLAMPYNPRRLSTSLGEISEELRVATKRNTKK